MLRHGVRLLDAQGHLGFLPMKQDIRSAFDKLVTPFAKHDDDFALKQNFVSERRMRPSPLRMMFVIKSSL